MNIFGRGISVSEYPNCPTRIDESKREYYDGRDISKWHVDLRKILAKHAPDKGMGRCKSCNLPWWVVEGHTVSYGSGGCFAVCETCWKDLAADELFVFYEQVVDSWKEYDEWKANDVEAKLDKRPTLKEEIKKNIYKDKEASLVIYAKHYV